MMTLIFLDNPGEVRDLDGMYRKENVSNANRSSGMLAAEYAASRTPEGLKRLIIANSPASIELCTIGMNALLSRFPPEFVSTIRKHEADGTTDSKEYQDAAKEFYMKHTCTTDPWPQELLQSFEEFAKDPTVYHTM
jgi:ABC-type sugar transport system substrate-binding protein